MWSLNVTDFASSRSRASLQRWWVSFPKITGKAWVALECISIIMHDPHAMSSLVRADLMRFNRVIECCFIVLCSLSQKPSVLSSLPYMTV